MSEWRERDLLLCNPEAERAVLGACLSDPHTLVDLMPMLEAQDFGTHAHRVLWGALTNLYLAHTPPDLVTVVEELTRQGAFETTPLSEVYLAECMVACPVIGHAHHYAKIVQDFSKRRQMMTALRDSVLQVADDSLSLDEVLSQIDLSISQALGSVDARAAATMDEIAQAYLDTFHEGPGPLVHTGIANVDDWIGGVRRRNLVVIASRPSMGKSALAIHLALHNARQGKRVIFMSLEMDEEEYFTRMLSALTMVNSRKLAAKAAGVNGEFSDVEKMIQYARTLPIAIDCNSTGDLSDVTRRVRLLHQQEPADLVIVDHCGLMEVGGMRDGLRTQEMAKISRGMKALAREIERPVFALHQLNRANSQRSDPRPILTDLRDSGTWEQDGDIICFLHREGYYKLGVDPSKTELIVAKYRNGPTGSLDLYYDMRHNVFWPWEQGERRRRPAAAAGAATQMRGVQGVIDLR